MDDGLPIAYTVLERDVPVYRATTRWSGPSTTSSPRRLRTSSTASSRQIGGTAHLILAEDIESLHEHGVHLRIDSAAAAALEAPHGAAPAWRVREPGVKPSHWNHFVEHMVPGETRRHNWNKLD